MKENKRTKMQTVKKWLEIVMVGSYLLWLALYLCDGQWLASMLIGIAAMWMLFAKWHERRADRLGDNAREAIEHWGEALGVTVALNDERHRLLKRCEGLVRAVRRTSGAFQIARKCRHALSRRIVKDAERDSQLVAILADMRKRVEGAREIVERDAEATTHTEAVADMLEAFANRLEEVRK